MPIIEFSDPASDASKVSDYTKKVLKAIMKEAGVSKITITSTARTAQEQAKAMYANIVRHGVDKQKALYGRYGDKVIDEYSSLKSAGKSKSEIIAGMSAKIVSVGSAKVSRHAADPNKVNVIDIAPSSITLALRNKFEAAVEKDSRVSRFFKPPKDPAYHLEIPQSEKK